MNATMLWRPAALASITAIFGQIQSIFSRHWRTQRCLLCWHYDYKLPVAPVVKSSQLNSTAVAHTAFCIFGSSGLHRDHGRSSVGGCYGPGASKAFCERSRGSAERQPWPWASPSSASGGMDPIQCWKGWNMLKPHFLGSLFGKHKHLHLTNKHVEF